MQDPHDDFEILRERHPWAVFSEDDAHVSCAWCHTAAQAQDSDYEAASHSNYSVAPGHRLSQEYKRRGHQLAALKRSLRHMLSCELHMKGLIALPGADLLAEDTELLQVCR